MATHLIVGTGFADIVEQLKPGMLFLQVSWHKDEIEGWGPSKFRLGHLWHDDSKIWNQYLEFLENQELQPGMSVDSRHGVQYFQWNKSFPSEIAWLQVLQLLSYLCQ